MCMHLSWAVPTSKSSIKNNPFIRNEVHTYIHASESDKCSATYHHSINHHSVIHTNEAVVGKYVILQSVSLVPYNGRTLRSAAAAASTQVYSGCPMLLGDHQLHDAISVAAGCVSCATLKGHHQMHPPKILPCAGRRQSLGQRLPLLAVHPAAIS